jgi:hypothetical protein
MVLVIFVTNVPIRKIKEIKKMIQIENKCINEIKPKRNSSRKSFAQKKITPHQMKMKIVEVRHKVLYSW